MGKKCVICGNIIKDGEETIPYKSRTAHLKCFNNMSKITGVERIKRETPVKKTAATKPKKALTELKEGLTEEEYQEKKAFFDYLRKLINTSELSAKIYKLTGDYLKIYPRFTYTGMQNTLKYYFEITGHPISGDCVGIIPYYYDEAEKYWSSVENIKKANEKVDADGMYKIKQYQFKPRPYTRKLIDIETIE